MEFGDMPPADQKRTTLLSYARTLAYWHSEYADGTKVMKLVLVGSSRNGEDTQRVLRIRNTAQGVGR